ncbi:MAG: Nramp family divalent metal transporter [Bacteroidota bacterium]|nr:Nramp family divalent metal transporter [Bacteroidota bacterium]
MPSLSEVNASVSVPKNTGFFRKLLAFLGPAYLISVGYMDPGNWATDIAGGSQFGYTLIWVLLMSNLIALLLQSLSARLGIVRGLDLAQVSRETYPPIVNGALYFLAEIAIAACDLAEVLGMAIGLQLLFGLPLTWGVCISVLDTFLLLFLLNFGMRKMEAFIIALVGIIGISFVAEMIFAQPVLSDIASGFIPSIPNDTALYIAIGIIGATVMPHNLYLHSSLVQTRKFERNPPEIKKAIKYNFIDTAIALNLALFVNAAILILAASVFFKNGMFEVAEIQDAHKLLEPMLGTEWAPMLFAIALIAAGQSSTITGTLAGQIVMEGYLNLRIQPWIRRLLTRLIAIVPALLTITILGEGATGKLLVFSQVILSLQLGFAVIPLIHFVSDKTKMGDFVIATWVKVLAWTSALIIVSLNAKLVYQQIVDWSVSPDVPSGIINFIVIPIAMMAVFLLFYTTFGPLLKLKTKPKTPVPHGGYKALELPDLKPATYHKIAVAIDFSKADEKTLTHAISQGGKEALYLLIHVVETPMAFIFGKETSDFETRTDTSNMEQYVENLRNSGYKAEFAIGFGKPKFAIAQKSNDFGADLLVMGSHGHHFLKDLFLGTTIEGVRHLVKIPVLVVR